MVCGLVGWFCCNRNACNSLRILSKRDSWLASMSLTSVRNSAFVFPRVSMDGAGSDTTDMWNFRIKIDEVRRRQEFG